MFIRNTDVARNHADRMIAFSPPDISELEINEIANVIRSGWITTGPRTKELEKRLAEYCGLPTEAPNLVCLNSCTAAEELNLRILGIGEGDEVIVPAYTYTATASAAIHVGAKVIFIDSQPNSVEMDYDAVEDAITERTKAVIPVDLGGVPCNYDRLFSSIENKKHLFRPSGSTDLGRRIQERLGRAAVVADCAHSLGSSYHGNMAGAIADFSSFSFHAVKNFTTAEGGAGAWKSIEGVDNEEIYHAYQLYSLHGQSKDALTKNQIGAWEYDIIDPLYKCNMTDIMAAIGLKQLDRYSFLLNRRKQIIEHYNKACEELGIDYIDHICSDRRSCGHLYITRIPGADEEERGEIIGLMAESGVAVNVHYRPLPMMTAYKKMGWNINDFPNSYKLYENEITLPLHTKLNDEDVRYVISRFRDAVGRVMKSH